MSVNKNIKANVSHDGDKFRVSYRYLDPVTNKYKNTCKRGFKLKREAKCWIETELPAIIARLEQKKKSIDAMTMDELIEEYCIYKKMHVRMTTFETKEHIIRTKILPFFKDMYVTDVEPIDIIKWQSEISKPIHKTKTTSKTENATENENEISTTKCYSNTYLRTINNQLVSIFNYATNIRKLPVNPCKGIKKLGKKNAPEREIWTTEEFKQFIETQEDNPAHYTAFMTLFWTGIREGELLGIKYRELDFENNIVYIKEGYHKIDEKIDTDLKNDKSYRPVRMPDFLTQMIKEYTDSLYNLTPYTRVFEINKSTLLRNLHSGAKKAKVKDITVHCLRHSYISMCVNNGLSFATIKLQVGHSEYLQTMHYTHSYKNASEHLAHTIENLYAGD